jgi:hypothetical protein
MTLIRKSIIIDATPFDINRIASNPVRWPEWYANIEEAKVDSIFPEVGGVVYIKFNILGVAFNIRFIQQEFIPVQKSVCRIDGRIKGTSHFELIPEGKGTRAILGLNYKVPGGPLLGLANGLFIKEMVNANLDTSLINLKNLVEAEA